MIDDAFGVNAVRKERQDYSDAIFCLQMEAMEPLDESSNPQEFLTCLLHSANGGRFIARRRRPSAYECASTFLPAAVFVDYLPILHVRGSMTVDAHALDGRLQLALADGKQTEWFAPGR